MNSELLNKVQNYVEKIFNDNAPPENIYHNLEHTLDVIAAVKEIAAAESIPDEQIELLLIAAWFHDTGCVECCKGHEALSADFAKSFLNSVNYPTDKVNQVVSLIKATSVPQSPRNSLEEILCDADLLHLGTKYFRERGDMLRRELERRGDATFTDEKWFEFSIRFVDSHHFFTKYCRDKYEKTKDKNLGMLKKKLKEIREN